MNVMRACTRGTAPDERVETFVAVAHREFVSSIAVDGPRRSDTAFFRCPWLEMGVLGELYALLDSSRTMRACWNDFALVCAQDRPSNVLAFELPSRLCALLRNLTPGRIELLGGAWVSSHGGIKRARKRCVRAQRFGFARRTDSRGGATRCASGACPASATLACVA
jgi:hypothetical protein